MFLASLTSSPAVWTNTLVGIVICLSRATMFRRKTMRDPWNMPVWLWGVIGLVLGLIGAVLVLIATRRSARTSSS